MKYLFPEVRKVTTFGGVSELKLTYSTIIRIKFKKVWYEYEVFMTETLRDPMEPQLAVKQLLDFENRFTEIVYITQHCLLYSEKDEECGALKRSPIQFSERERINLKKALLYAPISELI